MTRPYRRDADTKNGSVVTGLRMERPLAQRLTEIAREDARQRGEINPKTDRPIADLARETRLLLRLALWGGATEDPTDGDEWVGIAAGLKVEPPLGDAIRSRAATLGLGVAGTIRHTLRLQLGWTEQGSLIVEKRFAAIAVEKRAAMDSVRDLS